MKKLIQILILLTVNLFPVSCVDKDLQDEVGVQSSCEQAQDIISDCIGGRIYLESCNDGSEDVLEILSAKGCEEVLLILKGF